MKIVHSFWSKPAMNGDASYDFHRNKGGFYSHQHHLMSWALSCLQLREYYDDVQLITDTQGKALLVDKLGLPYTSVSTELEAIPTEYSQLWALGKLKAYSLQQEPFLHVDGDLFIWEKLSQEIESAAFVGLHKEPAEDYYALMPTFERAFKEIPKKYLDFSQTKGVEFVSNAGIIGGSEYTFFQEFWVEVERFLQNQSSPLQIENGMFNAIIEQFFISCRIKSLNLPVSYVVKDGDPENLEMAQFNGRLAHLSGPNKSDAAKCEQMSKYLEVHFPEYHRRIMNLDLAAGTSQNYQISQSTPYQGTKAVLKHFGVADADLGQTELMQHIESTSTALDERAAAGLQEVFGFEQAIDALTPKGELQKVRSQELQRYAEALKLTQLSDDALKASSLRVSNQVKMATLHWDWARLQHHPEDVETVMGANINQEGILLPSVELGTLVIPVNHSAVLLERFGHGKQVGEAVSEVFDMLSQLDDQSLQPILGALKLSNRVSLLTMLPSLLMFQVKEFIGQGILEAVSNH